MAASTAGVATVPLDAARPAQGSDRIELLDGLRAFAPAGRMALTNYLMHSVLAGLVFYGYGLGLAGYLPPWQWFLLALAIMLGQIEWSKRWLRRYRFGPVEWLWRCATYGKFMPIRIPLPEPGPT